MQHWAATSYIQPAQYFKPLKLGQIYILLEIRIINLTTNLTLTVPEVVTVVVPQFQINAILELSKDRFIYNIKIHATFYIC